MQHWPAMAAIPGQQAIANGSTIPIDRLIPGSFDFAALNAGYVRPNQQSNVLSGSSMHSAPSPYSHHQTLGYHFHPTLSVGGPQSVEPVISGRQYQNGSLNQSYQLQHFQQPGSVSQPLSLSHAQVPYGQSFSYLPSSLVTAMGNGALGHGHQYTNVPTGQQQQQHSIAMANAIPVRTFDSLKHFGALPQNQHIRRNKPMITSKTNLYISGLNESDTDDTVRALVENVVQPKSCKAMLTNGKCKGSGFIDCATEEDAEKAKTHILECSKVTGRKLSVKYAFENEKDTLNVYVRNLPRIGFTKEMLEELFRNYGNVTSVKLHETDAGLTGIGFVRFATAEEAEKAVEYMNEAKRIVGDSDKPITCKLADKAGPRSRLMTLSPQVHAAQAAVVAAAAAAAATGIHQSQISLGHNHFGRGTNAGLPNQNSIQTMGGGHLHQHHNPQHHQQQSQQSHQQQQQQSAYAQQFQLSTQLVQPLQQTSAVVVPNIQSSSAHARNILLSQALLPNGTAGATPSVMPMSFASVGSNGTGNQGNTLTTNNNNSQNLTGLYRTPLIGTSTNAAATTNAQSNNPIVVCSATPATIDSYSSRSKTGNMLVNSVTTVSNSTTTSSSSNDNSDISLNNQLPVCAINGTNVQSSVQPSLPFIQQQQSVQAITHDEQTITTLPVDCVYQTPTTILTPYAVSNGMDNHSSTLVNISTQEKSAGATVIDDTTAYNAPFKSSDISSSAVNQITSEFQMLTSSSNNDSPKYTDNMKSETVLACGSTSIVEDDITDSDHHHHGNDQDWDDVMTNEKVDNLETEGTTHNDNQAIEKNNFPHGSSSTSNSSESDISAVVSSPSISNSSSTNKNVVTTAVITDVDIVASTVDEKTNPNKSNAVSSTNTIVDACSKPVTSITASGGSTKLHRSGTDQPSSSLLSEVNGSCQRNDNKPDLAYQKKCKNVENANNEGPNTTTGSINKRKKTSPYAPLPINRQQSAHVISETSNSTDVNSSSNIHLSTVFNPSSP